VTVRAAPGWFWTWCTRRRADGGRTDINEIAPLCEHHHRMFEKLGWDCVLVRGVPHWRPPARIDPDRHPRRNTAHHTELLFTPPEPC
jgi:hypothetical protein